MKSVVEAAFAICVFVGVLDFGHAKNIPSFVKKCNRNDPQLGRCILDRANKVKPYISNGKSLPELNLPSLDPLYIPVVNVHTGTNSFNASFEDILVHGAIDFQLQDVVLDLKKNTMKVDLVIPHLTVNLRYVFRGEMLIVKLNAVGPGTIQTSNVHAVTNLFGVRQKRKGKEYLAFNRVEAEYTYDTPVVHFEKMFGDNEQLNEQTNKMINENMDELMVDFKPLVDESVNSFVAGIVVKVYNSFSIDELFE